jgi:formylglycine-generating enzyme required for sulfatase activity
MPLIAALLVAVAIPLVLARADPGKGTQYAFLVGCSGYKKTDLKPLPYTVNDVEGFREALLATGFKDENITLLHDRCSSRYQPEKAKILKELALLLDGLRPEDTLVVALSGHGVHFKGDKSGFFCPVDAELDNKATLIPMEGEGGLFDILKACKAKKKLLFVNACRNDPASDLAQAAKKVDLDDEDTDELPEGIAALYSCKAGQKSYYDPERKRGIFFDHLIRAWKGEYHEGDGPLELGEVFDAVRDKTKAEVNRTLEKAQVPQARREYKGQWIIGSKAVAAASAAVTSALALDLGDGVKMEFVRIPHGTFLMGSPESEEGRLDNEGPQHEVEITRDFFLGKYEVTRGQFRAFVNETGYKTDAETDGLGGWGYDEARGQVYPGRGSYPDTGKQAGWRKTNFNWQDCGIPQTDSHPVVNISWSDAQAFCKWLAQRSGQSVGLPTEAEWEHACRARTTTRYYSGDDAETLVRVGNTADRTFKKKFTFASTSMQAEDGYVFTAPVGQFEANAFGLYDMHGNVWEWCQDRYGGKDYAAYNYAYSGNKDPQGSNYGLARVMRGGSWITVPSACRSALRWREAPASRRGDVGFRVAVHPVRSPATPIPVDYSPSREDVRGIRSRVSPEGPQRGVEIRGARAAPATGGRSRGVSRP